MQQEHRLAGAGAAVGDLEAVDACALGGGEGRHPGNRKAMPLDILYIYLIYPIAAWS